MGNNPSQGGSSAKAYQTAGRTNKYALIGDNYKTIQEVTEALKRAGLESSNLIVGIDFTKSNEWTGKRTFGGSSLHAIDGSGQRENPYEQAVGIIGQTLARFDEDDLIPCFGFGDVTTHDTDVFSFYPDNRPCGGFKEALARYRTIAPHVRLAGPTSFAPIVQAAMKITADSGGQYHILLIIADGQVTRSDDIPRGYYSVQEEATMKAIVDASEYPLSIVLVGVGDGPWETMKSFDDDIPTRKFDNFQFVNFSEIMAGYSAAEREAKFALNALMEIPAQHNAIMELGIHKNCRALSFTRAPKPTPAAVPTAASTTYPMPGDPRSVDWPPRLPVAPAPSSQPRPARLPQMGSKGAENICPVCMNDKSFTNMAFQCGHQVCRSCGPNLFQCPICRRTIEHRLPLY